MGIAIFSIAPLRAQAAEVAHVTWDNLSMVTGHTVRIFLPKGSIEGTAVHLDPDFLVVDVRTTSDRDAYAKGMLKVPRANLRRLEMRAKGKLGRAILIPLGSFVGLVAGAVAVMGIDRCDIFGCRANRDGAAAAAFVGLTAAGVTGGYFAGNSLDKHWNAIEILP